MLSSEKEHLIKVDSILEKIITTIPTPEVPPASTVFHDLMSCILEQQIHYRSTKKIFQKMLDKSNLTTLSPDNFSIFEESAFKDIKLSMNKYETVLGILEYWNTNDTIWEELSDDEIRIKLSQIKGIGNWTIDMILLFSLNRPDVFSYDDFHMKQVMTSLYQLNPQSKLKAQMIEVASPWSPYKSTAFKYLLDWKTGSHQSLR